MRLFTAPLRFALALSGFALTASAPCVLAQTGVPRVRVLTAPTPPADKKGFVDASFSVSQDAYVFVVGIDRDGFVHVMQPDSASADGKVHRTTLQKVTPFFAGFGRPARGQFGSKINRASFPLNRYADDGVVIAIASDQPLQLKKLIDEKGDWDAEAIGQLLFNAVPSSAADALGRALTDRDQKYTTDFAPLFTSPTSERFLGFSLYGR